MKIPFTKMQGLGNDFIVFNSSDLPSDLTPEDVRRLSDRRFGIGCDQLLLVLPSDEDGIDFRYRIFNANGEEVEHCGNGARCFFRFVHENGLTDKACITVRTMNAVITLSDAPQNRVRVDMGVPIFEPENIPFEADLESPDYILALESETLSVGAVSLGNPHVVIQVDDVDTAPVLRLGPIVEAHPRFPNRVNVGFMQIVNDTHIRVRVFERGVGETLACGTGACAAVAIGRRQGKLAEKVLVDVLGGQMVIEWQGNNKPMLMTGPGETVFEGFIEL